MPKKILTFKGVVQTRDCNANNHMSMTQYVDKFDQAGQRFMLETGLVHFKNEGQGIVTIEQNTKYLKEAFEGNFLDIRSSLIRIGNKAFTVFHEMFNSDTEELISTMTIVFTFFDKHNKRALPFPKGMREKLLAEI